MLIRPRTISHILGMTRLLGAMANKSFIEFFAGIGLVHLGLLPREWKCIYANDIDPKKHQMYEDMFGAAPYYHVADVWETEEVTSRIQENVVLATASFPCVDLSLAGNRKGLAGKESGTFYGFMRVIEELTKGGNAPSIILIENVMGFLTSHGGSDFKAACTALSDSGYWLDSFMIDAKHFTPQSRPRLFIVGCKKEALPADAIRRPADELSRSMSQWSMTIQDQQLLRPKKLVDQLLTLNLSTGLFCLKVNPMPNLEGSIDDIIDKTNGDWWTDEKINKHLNEMSEAHRDRLASLSKGKTLTAGTMYRRVRHGKSRTEIRTDGLAGCLRTPRGGSSRQMVFVAGRDKVRMRWMSATEYAHLQGAPEFPLNVGDNQALFGFGDAVCVPAITWIADNYIEPLYQSIEKSQDNLDCPTPNYSTAVS